MDRKRKIIEIGDFLSSSSSSKDEQEYHKMYEHLYNLPQKRPKIMNYVKEVVNEYSDWYNIQSRYNKDLEDQVDQLYSVVQDIKTKKEIFETLIVQSEALSNLDNMSQPLFLSLSAEQIANLVNEVCCAYLKDFQMKEFIFQNIAHDQNLNNVMFLAACWTHQLDVTEDINFKLESLLVETNHRPIV